MDISAQKSRDVSLEKPGMLLRLFKGLSPREKFDVRTMEDNAEIQELLDNIRSARKEWESANINFDYACESEMVDYYTYKIKACQVRYEYFIKKAKEKGLRVESMDLEGVVGGMNS